MSPGSERADNLAERTHEKETAGSDHVDVQRILVDETSFGKPGEALPASLRNTRKEDLSAGPGRSGSLEMSSPWKDAREAGNEKLGAGKEQIMRAAGRLDPEIWEAAGKHQASPEQVANLRRLQQDMKSGNHDDPVFSAEKPGDLNLAALPEKFPADMMKKIDAFLIGEAACEIMRRAELSGCTERLTRQGDRLLKEAVLSVRLGHLASESEYRANSARVDSTIKNLQKDYPAGHEWTADDHARVAELLKTQESKSEHWSQSFAKPTHDGRLGCASYVTNGNVAKVLGEAVMPSLDLNVNGVVGESLIRGFQPRTVDEALAQARNAKVKDAMTFLIRPAVVQHDLKMTQNGHIGIFDATTGEVSHNKMGVGTREAVKASQAFAPAHQPYALVPPGWDKIR
jgi:hypothetical protein